MRRTTFVLLCLEGALLSFNVAACTALVPAIAQEFSLSQFVAGKIIWLYMLPYGVSALIYGPLVRSFDAKKIELACVFCFSCANLLAGFSENIASLFAARILMGLFGASVIPLALILIAREVQPQERGKAVGIFFSATFVASLLGLYLSGIISWRLLFLIPAAFGFLLFVHMRWYFPSFSQGQKPWKLGYLEAFKDRSIALVFTYIFLVSLMYHGVQQWLGVYFSQEYAFSQYAISMLIMLTSLSGVFGEVLGGTLADKLGRIKTVALGLVLMSASVFALAVKSTWLLLAGVMIVWGLGWTCNHAGVSTLLTDLPQEYVHEAASLNSGVRFISGGLGAALGGWVMQESFAQGFLMFGACLFALLFLTDCLLKAKASQAKAVGALL